MTNLIMDGPAFNGGLKVGDIITKFGDQIVHDTNALRGLVFSQSPNIQVAVELFRKNEGLIEKTITLGQKPKASQLPVDTDVY